MLLPTPYSRRVWLAPHSVLEDSHRSEQFVKRLLLDLLVHLGQWASQLGVVELAACIYLLDWIVKEDNRFHDDGHHCILGNVSVSLPDCIKGLTCPLRQARHLHQFDHVPLGRGRCQWMTPRFLAPGAELWPHVRGKKDSIYQWW